MTSIHGEIKKKSKYKVSTVQLKAVMKYLGWVNDENFNIEHPKEKDVNSEFSDFIWIETIDNLKGSKKIVFSLNVVKPLLEIVEDTSKHKEIFGDLLKFNAPKK